MSGRNNASRVAALLLCACLCLCGACNRGKTAPAASDQQATKRYHLKGKVVFLDKQTGTANVNNEPIAGFMDSMVMSYVVKPASDVSKLHVGDSITADLVAQGEDYWLENVSITEHAPAH
jgi:Cu/Ag efflux protein CusF